MTPTHADDNFAFESTAQQRTIGVGASNHNYTESVDGSDYIAIHEENVSVTFAELW
ncbi:hypothetical protein [Kitasatospora sp. NPDC002965]|uniref:hypothetical protein n=1 Tax=Kitasatospora sp. NPDC002965 TaxID=3154775 RepID=UPI0033A21200